MILPILQDMKLKPSKLAAIISLEGQQIRVESSSKFLSKIIETLLPLPTKIKTRIGDHVTKRSPRSVSENLLVTLKQNLYYPYRIASVEDNVDREFSAKYKKVYPTNILYGESRHESDRDAKREVVSA